MIIDNKQRAFQDNIEGDAGGAISDYEQAVAEIGKLEMELMLTKKALAESLLARNLLSKNLKICTVTLNLVEHELKGIESAIIDTNTCINECIQQLSEENTALKLSADVWLKQSIGLKFDLLTANDTMKHIKAERDFAISRLALQGR